MGQVTIRDLLPDDAPALTALFERCYGTTYGSPVFYDTPALHGLIASGGLRSVVAADGDTLLGHTGIMLRHAQARICETGNTVVDPTSRGQGLLKKLGGALKQRVLKEGFAGYVHYPTTAHEIMQRASVTDGGVESGVMLAYVGDTTDYKAVTQRPGRLAATVAYQPFAELPPREVVLPRRYAGLIRDIHRSARLSRTAVRPRNDSPDGAAEVESTSHAGRGLLALTLARNGNGLQESVTALIRHHAPKVTHIDLTLDDNRIDSAIDVLTGIGFFFCAVLPEFSHTDVLRLQALHDPQPGDFHPNLVNPTARRLCQHMREEAGIGEPQRP